jgi:hypothetical protein
LPQLSVAISALLFAAAGLAAFDDLAGCASASFGVSFGESASAVPTVRNSDKVSAANFFIASLFTVEYVRTSLGKTTTPRFERVEIQSYWYVN